MLMLDRVKSLIRRSVQSGFRFVSADIEKYTNFEHILIEGDGHFFIGYYDIDPISHSGENILCHLVSSKYTNFSEPNNGDIILADINSSNNHKKIAITNALNWQLGSRVQWIDKDNIIYNDVQSNIQCSKVVNVNTLNVEELYARSFWAISPNKKYGVALNFSRLKLKRPGYGYRGNSVDGDDDLLTVFSIKADEVLYQLSLKELLSKIGFSIPPHVDPYFNHVAWSPDSTKFISLFLFEDDVQKKRYSFPVLINLASNTVELFHSEGVFSHHVWLNNAQVLAYLKLDDSMTFALWTEDCGWKKLDTNMPSLDGHPSIITNRNTVIVDSYPDRLGRMSLYKSDLSSDVNKLEKLLAIANYPGYSGAQRCDLHPRVSCKNNFVICDMPSKNARKIIILKGVINDG